MSPTGCLLMLLSGAIFILLLDGLLLGGLRGQELVRRRAHALCMGLLGLPGAAELVLLRHQCAAAAAWAAGVLLLSGPSLCWKSVWKGSVAGEPPSLQAVRGLVGEQDAAVCIVAASSALLCCWRWHVCWHVAAVMLPPGLGTPARCSWPWLEACCWCCRCWGRSQSAGSMSQVDKMAAAPEVHGWTPAGR